MRLQWKNKTSPPLTGPLSRAIISGAPAHRGGSLMFSWVIDEQVTVLAALALITGTLGAVWWNTRKKWALIGTAATAALMVVVFVLSLVVETDSGKLRHNVVLIRDAVNGGKYEEALKFFDDKVKIKSTAGTLELSKDKILTMATRTKDNYQVKQIETGTVHVDELNRPHAKIRFQVGDADDGTKRGWCLMDCEYKQGKWVVTTMTVEALIGGQAMPVLLPVH
jgi:hypothetical protein